MSENEGTTYTLATRDVSYRTGGSTLLSGATLTFHPGTITGILGPSGSGKSTLLKCLTTIYDPSKGTVTINGEPVDSDVPGFRRLLGYVPQDDVIHRSLKVDQVLQYAARLRLPAETTAEEIENRIATLTSGLGLADRRTHRVRRLSGGQRKRVNIAVELLANPAVLVLDEPASGLDPGTEEDLLGLLRRLADMGKTVLLTTHSMEFLDALDQIVVLDAGKIAFAGPLDAMLAHFGITHPADVFKALRQHEETGGAEL
ncbi:MAG: ABC transporter ATP-binding protein [Lentisphaeria bacterium]|nr:ABC transporter ATP-binding protein [Lentisphaeria bacterium]